MAQVALLHTEMKAGLRLVPRIDMKSAARGRDCYYNYHIIHVP